MAKVWKDEDEPQRDWRLATLGILIVLIAILIGRAVWNDSEKMLEQAKAEYISCLEAAQDTFDPEESISQCESEWKEAQDAYWVP